MGPCGIELLALLALTALHECSMAYLYRRTRSPYWYVVYLDADKKEVHRSTGLRADNPNETAKAKALRAELEAKEHHRTSSQQRRVGHLGSKVPRTTL